MFVLTLLGQIITATVVIGIGVFVWSGFLLMRRSRILDQVWLEFSGEDKMPFSDVCYLAEELVGIYLPGIYREDQLPSINLWIGVSLNVLGHNRGMKFSEITFDLGGCYLRLALPLTCSFWGIAIWKVVGVGVGSGLMRHIRFLRFDDHGSKIAHGRKTVSMFWRESISAEETEPVDA